MAILNFYMDESGAQHPDHQPPTGWNAHCHWFALGGVLVNDDQEEDARRSILEFRQRWPAMNGAPLHSDEIRNRRDNFQWLNQVTRATHERFMDELTALIMALPIVGA